MVYNPMLVQAKRNNRDQMVNSWCKICTNYNVFQLKPLEHCDIQFKFSAT